MIKETTQGNIRMMVKTTVIRIGLCGVLAATAVATLPTAHAFGLDSVKNVVGGSASDQSGVDVDALLSEKKDLMGRFHSSMNNMLLAQAKTLEAAGFKEDAQRAAATAETYASGNVVSKDQLARDTQSTTENTAKIQQYLQQDTQLSAEGRKLLVAAVPHYGKGMYDGTRLPNAFDKWKSSAKGGLDSLTSNPLRVRELTSSLSEVTTVATNLPSLLKAWGSTSVAFVDYAKSNDVDVSDVESKLGDL